MLELVLDDLLKEYPDMITTVCVLPFWQFVVPRDKRLGKWVMYGIIVIIGKLFREAMLSCALD